MKVTVATAVAVLAGEAVTLLMGVGLACGLLVDPAVAVWVAAAVGVSAGDGFDVAVTVGTAVALASTVAVAVAGAVSGGVVAGVAVALDAAVCSGEGVVGRLVSVGVGSTSAVAVAAAVSTGVPGTTGVADSVGAAGVAVPVGKAGVDSAVGLAAGVGGHPYKALPTAAINSAMPTVPLASVSATGQTARGDWPRAMRTCNTSSAISTRPSPLQSPEHDG